MKDRYEHDRIGIQILGVKKAQINFQGVVNNIYLEYLKLENYKISYLEVPWTKY